jgi:Tol biopolymer transport system component
MAATASGLAVCLTVLVLAPSAPATFPGKNGKIAFLHRVQGSLAEVYTMRRDGSHERRIALSHSPAPPSPAFSPNGRKVLFSRRGSSSLFTIRANGTRLRRIPHTAQGYYGGGFAPSGKRIVFSRSAILYTIRINGSRRKRIAHARFGYDPRFSPNGRWIVYESRGLCQICLIRPDGTERRSLTEDEGDISDDSPDFSPDGRRIVFARRTGRRNGGIYTIRKDGTHLKRLYEATDEIIRHPVFSPDGRKIAFSRDKRSWRYSRVYTIRPDGSHLRRLSHGRGHHRALSWGVRP